MPSTKFADYRGNYCTSYRWCPIPDSFFVVHPIAI